MSFSGGKIKADYGVLARLRTPLSYYYNDADTKFVVNFVTNFKTPK